MLQRRILWYSMSINSHCCTYLSKRWNSKYFKELAQEKRSFTLKALSHFDDFYGSIYQDQWPSMRVALLSAEKNGIVINNFSDKERILKEIQSEGAFNVREVCKTHLKGLKENASNIIPEGDYIYQIDGRIEETLLRQQQADVDEIYPEPLSLEAAKEITKKLADRETNPTLDDDGNESNNVPKDPTKDQPLAESLKTADYDNSRLIVPGLTGFALTASLYDYVPATKLKGLDDYIPESAHFRYYSDAPEAPTEFQMEDEIKFPELLDVYAFERGNCDTFEFSKRGSTNVFDYHIISLGSLAPTLALGMRQGEVVLDMTSSSLDIPMLISQTLIPGMFVVNCGTSSRGRYLLRHLDSFLFEDRPNVIVTDYHPLDIQDSGKFDKIIICPPSTYDRKAVTQEQDNMFSPARVKDRIRLPEVQATYLKKALELVKEGGAVVYYTESLSPIQNDAVVQRVLDDIWFNSKSQFIVKDLSKGLEALQPFMKIVKTGKFGHLVVPFLPNNCGPMYLTKLVKCAHKNDETVEITE